MEDLSEISEIYIKEEPVDSDLNDDERHHSDSSLSNYEEDGSEDHWMKTTSGLYESQDTLNDELSMVCKTDEEPKVEVEKRHECPMCQECFKTNSALNGHLVKRHKTTLGERFTCHVCGALASSRGAMRRHLLRTHKITNIDHPKLLTRKCSLCRSSFSSHHLLYEHMKTAHEDELAGYSHCLWCPVIVKVKASLIRHVRRNHPDKAEAMSPVVACEVCNADLPNIPKLQQHIKKNHPNYRRHKCDQCGAVYRYPYMLSRHKLVHENPVKYEDEIKKRQKYYIQCNNCEKKFGSKRRLLTHLRNNHTPEIKEERVYTCRVCAMSFSTAKQNKRHYRILHMRERLKVHCGKCNITFTTPEECDEHRATVHPSSCDICHKQFLKRDSLREHLLIHSAPRHPCPHCDKKFTQRSNLKRHIRLHTGEKPYKCIYCSRSFSDKSAFNSHLRIHTGYTRSVCDVCGSSFANKQKLKYHLKIHSGEGLYHCPICTRPYTTSYAFRKHVPSHQMPLTKALEALGFTSLLQADPHFVENALLAVIQYTLASISKRIGKLGSTDELNSDVSSFNSSLNFGPLSSPPSLSCPNRLLEVKVESQVGSGPSNKAELDGGCCPETSSSSAKFDLTKFFQNILERQTKEIRKKRLRKRKVLPNYNEATNSDDQEGLVTEPAIDSLPETVGDELVKRCLEIVVKSEPKSESDEEFESKSFQKGGELRVTTFPLVEVMTERAETPPPNLEDSKLVPVEEIPKLKISKISQDDKDEGSGVTFISKII